ncbi:MAG: TonB-dependent receptor [Bacteroidota bacterium]
MRHIAYSIFCSVFLLLSSAVNAQTGFIRGTVYETATGDPLFGVAVRVPGTSTGAVTDFDGKFNIKAPPGTYSIEASFVSFQTVTITDLVVNAGDVTVIDAIWMEDALEELEAVIVSAEVIKNSESALLTVKRKSANVLDGISSESFRKIGDSNAGEAAKRVTGVSVEGGKYVYVRGLGDRYSKTTLNGLDIPGLDPDRNSIQIDVFPTNLIDNMVVVKSFTPELPADFTGGIVNIETKDFPEERVLDVSFSVDYNPGMHFNSDYLEYEGSGTDWLGYDNGIRQLPDRARQGDIPQPRQNPDGEVGEFLGEFGPTLGASNATSFTDYSLGITAADQLALPNGHTLGYQFSASYQSETRLFDEIFFGEYQNSTDLDQNEFQRAFTQEGILAEQSVLIGGLAGLAYKTSQSKYRINFMHLQNGETRSGQFDLLDDDDAIGKSGYTGLSDNLEYNQRSVTNAFINGEHNTVDSRWKIDWRASWTQSNQEDPDIRKTAFSRFGANSLRFVAGAAGNPSRLWRELDEANVVGRVDVTRKFQFNGQDAKLKFGGSHTYKERDYEILNYNVNFFRSQQPDWTGDAREVWTDENLYPNGSIFLVSGVDDPNPNEYNATVNNTAAYVSGEFSIVEPLKTIIGVRAENFVQRHTGRNQGATIVLEDEKVLDALDFFPSVNLIYALQEKQNLRGSYSRTIARPSFKELSFASILDPVSNRIFTGGLFAIDDWDGNLVETRINNFDLRWELFMERGQIFSVSAFYKDFDQPIELVRLPQQQTNAEFQPRNVGDGRLYGLEVEFRKALDFITPALTNWSIYGNLTLVESFIDISPTELRNRENNARNGEEIGDTRNMAGQAPWIVNAGIQYSDLTTGLDAGIFYNVKGRTLIVVGGGIDPDIFTEPFHSLNFNLNKAFGEDRRVVVTLGIDNILGDKLEQFYRRDFGDASDLFTRYNPGTSIGAGVKYSF